jgi:hypothetical protein
VKIAPPRLSRPGAIRPELIAAGAALLVVLLKLHVPSLIGLADSSDFARLMQPLGLHSLSDDPAQQYNNYVNQFYAIGPRGPIEYPSSALLFLWIAVRLSGLLHPATFDITVAGVLYALLFAGGVYLLVRGARRLWGRPWLTWTIAGASLLIGADGAFITYFHSLYSEPASYVTLLLLLGALLNLLADDRPDYGMLAIFALAALGFFTAKNQDFPLILILLAFGVRLALSHRAQLWRVLLGAAYAVILGAALLAFLRTPAEYDHVNVYDSVFVGILHGDTPQQAASDLTTLGVDPQYADLAGHPYYDRTGLAIQQDAAFTSAFYAHVSKTTVLRFYATHPDRLLGGLRLSADAAITLRPDYLGNFTGDSGAPPRAQAYRLDLWTWLSQTLFPRALWVLALYYLAYFALVVRAWRRAKSARARAVAELCGAIGLMALMQFAIPFLAEGTYELVKHLFLYDVLFALTLVIAATWLASRLAAWVRRRGQPAETASATSPAAEREPIASPVRAGSPWLMPFRALRTSVQRTVVPPLTRPPHP